MRQVLVWIGFGAAALLGYLNHFHPQLLRQSLPGQGSTQVHKCLVGGQLQYSSAPCPAGSQEAAMTRGTVTVIAAPAAAPKPAAAAASLPTVRDLLAPPGEVDLQQRRIDQVTR